MCKQKVDASRRPGQCWLHVASVHTLFCSFSGWKVLWLVFRILKHLFFFWGWSIQVLFGGLFWEDSVFLLSDAMQYLLRWRATNFTFGNIYAMLIFVYFYFRIFFSVNLLLFITASHPFLYVHSWVVFSCQEQWNNHMNLCKVLSQCCHFTAIKIARGQLCSPSLSQGKKREIWQKISVTAGLKCYRTMRTCISRQWMHGIVFNCFFMGAET